MNKKPNLLLIAGYFPPVRISAGSIRPWNIARYLIQIGWNVTVVTPEISTWDPVHLDSVEKAKRDIQKSGINMIYTSHSLKCLSPTRYDVPDSKIYWFVGGVLRVINRKIGVQNWVGWVPSALWACKDLGSDDVDVILATGAPFWGFEIANRLSKRLGIPYVMDYRDLWTDNPWAPVSQKWVAKQERRLLNNSAAVIVVSKDSGKILGNKYDVNKKITTITNGYDKDDVQKIKEKEFDHFGIIFAGSLISAQMTLASLFVALNRLKKNELENWKFHYFGPNTDIVERESLEYGLKEYTIIHGNIPRQEVLKYEKGAMLNVVLSSDGNLITKEDKGVVPGKVYELIGLEATVLPIVPRGSAVEQVFNNVGVSCFSHDETNEIANYIVKCMNGYKTPIINKTQYSWEKLSKKFDILLRGLIDKNKIL